MATALPIACSLKGVDLQQRGEWLERLGSHVVSREPISGGMRLRFEPVYGLEHELTEVAAAESRCCPFLTLSLQAGKREIELEITGPPDAREIIDQMFRHPSRS